MHWFIMYFRLVLLTVRVSVCKSSVALMNANTTGAYQPVTNVISAIKLEKNEYCLTVYEKFVKNPNNVQHIYSSCTPSCVYT